MDFETVFDISQAGYTAGKFCAFGLIFVALGVLAVFAPVLLRRFNLPPSLLSLDKKRGFCWFFFLFSLAWTGSVFFGTYTDYRNALTDFETGRYSIVEGRVTDFVPMPYEGHADERFTVNGQSFSYSDYLVVPGFHNASSHGGPVYEGAYVRIAYSGNIILRLEIAR